MTISPSGLPGVRTAPERDTSSHFWALVSQQIHSPKSQAREAFHREAGASTSLPGLIRALLPPSAAAADLARSSSVPSGAGSGGGKAERSLELVLE